MYKVIKEVGFGIVAKIVADSVNDNGNRITTFELEYPRMVHSELMTHRLLSRNAMSSRAIPVSKMIDQVRSNPAKPVQWGKNKGGMQSDGDWNAMVKDQVGSEFSVDDWWHLAAEEAAFNAEALAEAGYHKQVANRLLEPFQFMKTIVTATEMENFFWLRLDEDADPTIKKLAEAMFEAYKESVPEQLNSGDWHTPYVTHFDAPDGSGQIVYGVFDGYGVEHYVSKKEAIAISSSCCAQVSYRNIDNTYDKAMSVYERLGVGGNKIHASPFEHVATPMKNPCYDLEVKTWDELFEVGATHIDKDGYFWSGNFKGWIQHRQLLDNHTKW